jgi:hypothetical protein
VAALGLAAGMRIHALVKSVSIEVLARQPAQNAEGV